MSTYTKYRLTWLYEQWTLRREDAIQFVEVFWGMNQQEAIAASIKLLEGQGAYLFVHDKVGRTREKIEFPASMKKVKS